VVLFPSGCASHLTLHCQGSLLTLFRKRAARGDTRFWMDREPAVIEPVQHEKKTSSTESEKAGSDHELAHDEPKVTPAIARTA